VKGVGWIVGIVRQTERANCLPLDCWKFKFENPGLLRDQMESLKSMLSLHFTDSLITLITRLESQLTWHFFQSCKEPGTLVCIISSLFILPAVSPMRA
jgi:hypothetical protein